MGKTKSPTPPPPVKEKELDVTMADEGEETASEEDLDAGISPPTPQPPKVSEGEHEGWFPVSRLQNWRISASTVKPPAVKRAIGKIGGRKPAPSPPSPPLPPAPPPAAVEESKAEGVKKRSIGKIGGNRKALAESTFQKAASESPETVGSTVCPTWCMDRIGAHMNSQLQTQTLSPPSRVQSSKPQTPEPELDEDEKADRKRRQLEKELEAKKKAPPKKKRKFWKQ
jgi:hypothetical protein